MKSFSLWLVVIENTFRVFVKYVSYLLLYTYIYMFDNITLLLNNQVIVLCYVFHLITVQMLHYVRCNWRRNTRYNALHIISMNHQLHISLKFHHSSLAF